ncbi:type I polyketide synthase [Pseudonocardia sp. NPDC049635]|uniref:type I polyketide synthase n=1 Tax=Pseudonocardia sp. NPDC049635 TaxID=3155506 RepID=UPI0033DD79D2
MADSVDTTAQPVTDTTALVDALRASLKDNERLRRAEQQRLDDERDPIAIVGLGCRYPGDADTPERLWEIVRDGRDVTTGFPTDRGWDLEALYDPDPDTTGTTYTRRGGFLVDATRFDPGFFGISPREARAMDPQQRLLLEVSWEALERAGMAPDRLRDTAVGVYTGAAWQGYGEGWRDAPDGLQGHLVTGMSTSVISGRIAYTFNLRGPAVTLDTACSSSLVSVHLAAQALRRGDCTVALAGGAAVISSPIALVGFARQRGLAEDGRCKAFGAGADGMVLGEGAGVVVLERLSRARAHGHPVLALLRGSAVNQDGASNGLSAPSGAAQQDVVRAALADAGLTPGDVDAVEAHGTGTTLGDPIEAQALLEVYGAGRTGAPLHLGSVKSNIGHAQAASGIAGLIKTVLALEHGELPATLHADPVTDLVDWDGVEVLTRARPWPAHPDRPRRAGISSFGVSGTNAHLVVEEAPATAAEHAGQAADPPGPLAWVLSARDADGLTRTATGLDRALDVAPDTPGTAAAVASGLARHRARLDHGAVVLGEDLAGLRRGVRALAAGRGDTRLVTGTAGGSGRPVFVYPGQGAQWAGMARDLYRESPDFAAELDRCAAALAPHLDGTDLVATVTGDDDGWLDRVDLVQPGLFAVMVALTALWRSHGVEPAAVVGHSQGEIAAAHVAGALTLDDAARVVALRARAIAGIAGAGAMLSVGLGRAGTVDRIAGRPGLWLAAENGAQSCVVSGDVTAVAALQAELEAGDEIRVRRVPVDYASHSAHVDAVTATVLADLAPITPSAPRLPLYSTVTGARLDPRTPLDAAYWVRNLRSTVELRAATDALLDDGFDAVVEVAPHPVLLPVLAGTAEAAGRDLLTVPTLHRDRSRLLDVLGNWARLWVHGTDVDLDPRPGGHPVVPDTAFRPGLLPTFPFADERYWLAPTGPSVAAGAPAPREEALWAAVDSADTGALARVLDVPAADLGPGTVAALAGWRRRECERAVIDGWRYRETWEPLARPAGSRPGRWLLAVSERTDRTVVDEVTAALVAAGADVAELVVPPDGTVSLPALLGASGVLALLAFDAPEHDGPGTGRPPGFDTGVALLRATGSAVAGPPLWFATRDAVAVAPGEHPARPAHAAFRALARIAAAEYPDRPGGTVDLPATLDRRAASRLLAHLHDGVEQDVALRPGGAHGRRIVPAPAPAAASWTPRGTVLVTGGTGGLAGHLARRLADLGAEHLVLAGRRGPDAPGATALAEDLRARGARVTVAACDVTDRAALTGLLAQLPDLRAVVHTAGVLDDALIADLTPERTERVMAPKVLAAGLLAELTADRELDAFVLYSSFAAFVGGAGQAAYAAANAVLDALARQLRGQGRPASSLAWGMWDGAGMVDPGQAAALRRAGMGAMDPDRAVDALLAAVGAGEDCRAVAAVDWARLRAATPALRDAPLLAGLPGARTVTGPDPSPAAPATADRDALRELVTDRVAAALGFGDGARVDPGRSFRDLGFDSLTAVDLRNRLAEATGLTLPVTLVFDHPTVDGLAGHLHARLASTDEHAPAAAPATTAPAATDEPVAIIGMACRLPGGVQTPEQLWTLLADGVDAVGEFPTDRGWDVVGLHDPDPDTPGTFYSTGGGFLHDAADFDPGFFGISPREALTMDPQQRLLLETAWEACERAGIDPGALRGTRTGVYVGASYNDYGSRVRRPGPDVEGHLALGSASSVVSGRIAYTFGWEGPAVTVDTACSSSLVALHTAVRALRTGECDRALAGGAVIMSTLDSFIEFSRQRAVSPDGRCRAFSADAAGAGWAEGVGTLLLEPLSVARELGHPVLAVVHGSAVNSDGASNGLTAPSGPAQQRVVRAALADAGLTPADVDAVEAHGTGTPLGDPIEAGALQAVFAGPRPHGPVALGTLKSNLGHTQAASGIAGVIKMVLALQHAILPRTLHAEQASPHIDWSGGELALLSTARPWEPGPRPRVAGVSSFGVSGTNAHVVLGEAPAEAAGGVVGPAGGTDGGEPAAGPRPAGAAPVPWLLSARGTRALPGQAGAVLDALGDPGDPDGPGLADVAAALAGRVHHDDRAVVVAHDPAQARAALAAIAADRPDPAVVTGSVRHGLRSALLFTGQGAQRAGTGRGLYETDDAFADALDEACAHLDPHLDRPLRPLLFAAEGTPDAALLDRTGYTQPALFAIEVATAAAVRARGIEPVAVAGHSVGEFAAAHVAGVLSLADAATLVAARARLMDVLPTGGAMLSVRAGETEVAALLADDPLAPVVAAVNGPASTVLSGTSEAIARAARTCAEAGLRTRTLTVSHAFHSPLMEPVLDELRAVAADLTHHRPHTVLVSSVTGRPVTDDELGPDYWVRQVVAPVRWQDAVRAVEDTGAGALVEVGPGGVLSAMSRDCLRDDDTLLVPVLRPGTDEPAAALAAFGTLWTAGARVSFDLPGATRPVRLPTYAFRRRRYWLDAVGDGPGITAAGQDEAGHPLLAAEVALAGTDGGAVFTGALSTATHPWLAGHAVAGSVLFPGTGFLELALHAGARTGAPVVEELTIGTPLVLADTARVQVTLQVAVAEPDTDGRRAVTVHSRTADGPWHRHAAGTLGPAPDPVVPAPAAHWPPAGAEPLAVDGLYDLLADSGFDYGPEFRGLHAAWRDGDDVVAEVAVPERARAAAAEHLLHPALTDAALHTLAFGGLEGLDGGLMPFSWGGVRAGRTGVDRVRVRVTTTGRDTVALRLTDTDGAPVLEVAELVLRPVATDLPPPEPVTALHRLDWVPAGPAAGATPAAGRWALVGPHLPGGVSAVDTALPAGAVERHDDLAALRAGTGPAPDVLVLGAPVPPGDTADEAGTLAALGAALALVQDVLADPRLAGTRTLVLTRDAAVTRDGEVPAGTGAAAVAGLVRSAATENPGRFAVVDLAGDDPDAVTALPAAAASGEPQVAVRGGRVLVPRLVPLAPAPPGDEEWTPGEGTVVVTGATGSLGGLAARHAVLRHGARRLLLLGRRGADAPGIAALRDELTAAGATVDVRACDVTDPAALDAALAAVPPAHPVTTVLHTAGVLDDGVVHAQDADRLARVLAPKLGGALALAERTAGPDLRAFVLWSSISGTLGGAGQAPYAAANAALDALAQRLRAGGTPARSLAWGVWSDRSTMTDTLDRAGRARVTGSGLAPMPAAAALAQLDAALARPGTGSGEALLAPIGTDPAALRAAAAAGRLPAALRELAPAPPARAGTAATGPAPTGPDTAARFAGLSGDARTAALLDLVRTTAAGVLAVPDPEEIEPRRGLLDLGFDSLTAVELRNRLGTATGLRLPVTLMFDHPTPQALAAFLDGELPAADATPAAPADLPELAELDGIARRLDRIAHDEVAGAAVADRLARMLADLGRPVPAPTAVPAATTPPAAVAEATDDELFALIDRDLGAS